jgi:hypothetical protein
MRTICTLAVAGVGALLAAGCQTSEPGVALVRATTVQPTTYAEHFAKPGERHDQNGRLVDADGFLIDKNGRRLGGRGYWVHGPGDTVPPGTYVEPMTAQAIMLPPAPRYTTTTVTTTTTYPTTTTTAYPTRTYPYSNTTAFWQ